MRLMIPGAVGLAAGVSLLLAACGSTPGSSAAPSAALSGTAASALVQVVASTNVYGDIVKQVGGDKVTVVSIISDPSQDPHSYEANTQNQLQLSKARIVIENGGGYDDFVDTMLKASGNTSAEVLDVVTISGKTAPAGGELNEHVWYDFPSVAKLTDRLAAALGKADPADAALFAANAAAFKGRLTSLESQEQQINTVAAGEGVAVTEPVPLYMLEAAGLVNRTPAEFSEAIEEGDDVPPRALQETIALMTGKKVAVLVYNEQTAGPPTEMVKQAAQDNGIAVVPVTETLPTGKDYLGWMSGNLAALKDAVTR